MNNNNDTYNEFDELDYNEYLYNKAEPIYYYNSSLHQNGQQKINNTNKETNKANNKANNKKETKINKPKSYKLSDYL